MRLKVGDRVIGIGIMDDNNIENLIGTVICYGSGEQYGIEFDEDIERGHDCHGEGKHGYCWYCNPETIELYDENPQSVYSEDDMMRILHI